MDRQEKAPRVRFDGGAICRRLVLWIEDCLDPLFSIEGKRGSWGWSLADPGQSGIPRDRAPQPGTADLVAGMRRHTINLHQCVWR